MHSTINLYATLALLLLCCCGNPKQNSETPVTTAEAKTSQAAVEEAPKAVPVSSSSHNDWDGFYFYNIGMGSIIVIHDGKYYNFERKNFRSFYKDFEYDIDFKLNKDGFIPITRQYYLDRNAQLQSKEKVLFDSQPIEEGGKTVALQCRGYKYLPLSSFGAYLDAISTSRSAVIEDLKTNSKYSDDQLIEAALNDPAFISKSKMTEAPLRGGELAFWQLLVNIIEAK